MQRVLNLLVHSCQAIVLFNHTFILAIKNIILHHNKQYQKQMKQKKI